MQARVLVNILLLLIAVALVYLLWQHEDETLTQAVTLTSIKTDAIDTINIHHKQRNIKLVKHGQHWLLTEPIKIAANDFRVGTVLKLLKTTSHNHYPADSLELEKFGLQQPQTTIRFNQTEIEFGITNPISDKRYVKAGDSVHLIDDNYYPLLSSQLGTLVSLKLLDDSRRIIKLELPEQTLSLDDKGNWQSSAPLPADAMVQTVEAWKNTQAFGVHDYFKRDAIESARLYLEGDDAPIKFVVTDSDPWLVLARPDLGIEYHLDLKAYKALLRPGTDDIPPAHDQTPESDDVLHVSPDEFMQQLDE